MLLAAAGAVSGQRKRRVNTAGGARWSVRRALPQWTQPLSHSLHAVRALPPRRHRRGGSGTCVHTPCTSIKSWDGGGAPTDAWGCLCSSPCEQHQRAGSTAHMRRGGTAARASGATLSTYITICVYRLLRKHDRLARNTADLSESLIKQKKTKQQSTQNTETKQNTQPGFWTQLVRTVWVL